MPEPLPRRAAAVVIGGGAIGTSVAFHLAEAGLDGVVLVERAELASGSTSKAAGGVRVQFSDELNVAIALRSLQAYDAFERRPGAEIDLHRVGYLFLLDDPSDVASFERSVALQNGLGVPSRLVEPAEAARLCPVAGLDGVLAASFCPLDGHASPEAVVHGYAAGARALGARIETGCAVNGLDTTAAGTTRVVTARGKIETEVVVCAAGAWSPALAAMVDVPLPVTPYLREVGFTGPAPELPPALPLTIDFSTGFYFHREGPGLLFGMADPAQPPGFDAPPDPAWLEKVLAVAERRAPTLPDMGFVGGWSGYYEVTPDHNALIGEAPGHGRFLYATGFSGHGFLQAPAVGEIVRDLVLGRQPFVDVGPLRAERFAEGRARPEHNVV